MEGTVLSLIGLAGAAISVKFLTEGISRKSEIAQTKRKIQFIPFSATLPPGFHYVSLRNSVKNAGILTIYSKLPVQYMHVLDNAGRTIEVKTEPNWELMKRIPLHLNFNNNMIIPPVDVRKVIIQNGASTVYFDNSTSLMSLSQYLEQMYGETNEVRPSSSPFVDLYGHMNNRMSFQIVSRFFPLDHNVYLHGYMQSQDTTTSASAGNVSSNNKFICDAMASTPELLVDSVFEAEDEACTLEIITSVTFLCGSLFLLLTPSGGLNRY